MAGLGDTLAQGAGGAVNVLDLIQSIRSGQLGQTLMKRQLLTQDPSFRDSIANSPFFAGMLGLGGQQAPQPVDMPQIDGLPSPSAPARTMQFRTNLPPLGPVGQLEQQGKQTDLDYKLAQIGATQQKARYLQRFNEGNTSDRPPGMIQSGISYGPNGPTTSFTNPATDAPIRVPFGATRTGDFGGRPTIQDADPATQAEATKKAQELGKLAAAREQFGKPTLDLIDGMIGAARNQLPSGLGGFLGSETGATGIFNRGRLALQSEGPASADLRKLRGGDLLIQQLYRLSAVGVATEQDVKPYADRLKGLEGMSAPEAENRLRETRDYIVGRLYGGQDPTGQMTSTTTEAGTPSSVTSTTMPISAGLTPEELQQHRANVFGPLVRQLRRAGTR